MTVKTQGLRAFGVVAAVGIFRYQPVPKSYFWVGLIGFVILLSLLLED